jgi:hypothetical protein
MSARTYKAVMHFNKQGAKKGLPWTVHFRGTCYPASVIRCQVPMISEWKPNKKSNPRAFFTAQVHTLIITGAGLVILQ